MSNPYPIPLPLAAYEPPAHASDRAAIAILAVGIDRANTLTRLWEPQMSPMRPRDYIGAALCLVGAVLLAGFAAAVLR
jgi:phage terminase large subunit-like protein